MMPIMSVVQQGGCYPSCRLVLGKQRIYTTAFCQWWFSVSHATYLCLFLGFWSCSPFKWLVWVPWSSCFCPLLSPSLPPSSLAFCQSSQDFRWNDAVTKRARQRLPNMPSQVFVSRGPPLPPPPLLPPLLLLSYPHPRILENRKCILLSDGWAPCSCWEEREKKPFFPSRAVRWV